VTLICKPTCVQPLRYALSEPPRRLNPRCARGAIYRPRSNSWRLLPPPPPKLRHWKPDDTAIWSGEQLLVWGGTAPEDHGDFIADGAAYDPGQGRWQLLPQAPIAGRDRHVAIWTGVAMLIWGRMLPKRSLPL
jgi:hypothetical protein